MSQARSSILSSRTNFRHLSIFLGIILVIAGLILGNKLILGTSSVEVLQTPDPSLALTKEKDINITVDVSGEVVAPGVYHLPIGSRVDDALTKSGGLSEFADKTWVDKNLNRAAKLTDGQKIFIPSIKQSEVLSANNSTNNTNVAQSYISTEGSLININTASLEELVSLSGIGQVYGQNIIDHRPYSDINELTTNKIIPQSTFNKVKDKITTY